MLHNYHTHTLRCNHALGTDREYVEAAIQRGLKTLGFSDHAPFLSGYDTYASFRMGEDSMYEYAESVRALQKEYEKDIRILCGFELEYYPEYHKEKKDIDYKRELYMFYTVVCAYFNKLDILNSGQIGNVDYHEKLLKENNEMLTKQINKVGKLIADLE